MYRLWVPTLRADQTLQNFYKNVEHMGITSKTAL